LFNDFDFFFRQAIEFFNLKIEVWNVMIDEIVDFTSQSGSTEPSQFFNAPVINTVIY